MSEQQTTSACPHPDAVGTRWGDQIKEDRQRELQLYLDRWEAETDHRGRRGPFDKQPGEPMGVPLTGADVFWLAEQSERDEQGLLSNLHLEGAFLDDAHLEGAYLVRVRLEGAYLRGAHLKVAGTSLEETSLVRARLEKVSFDGAQLDEVDLREAHLESAWLGEASLKGANLRGAWLDSKTVLREEPLDKQTRLGDIQWGGVGAVNLTKIDWSCVPRLGDEHETEALETFDRDTHRMRRKTRAERLADYEAVVRAYRQVSVQLRAQGMSEVADRFLYRSQRWQRRVLWRQGNLLGYLFSLLLAMLSGYGNRIWRIFATYALTVVAFAVIFYLIGIPNDPATTMQGHAVNALLVSLTAIHGRTFFEQFAFTVQGWVAAIESIIGIVIEGVFVAMLIQRFFGR
jgi:hypothetical protein